MSDSPQRISLDPEGISRMNPEERRQTQFDRRARMIETGPPELRDQRVRLADSMDAAMSAMGTKSLTLSDLGNAKRQGVDEKEIRRLELELKRASEIVTQTHAEFVDIERHIRHETHRIRLEAFPSDRRGEADRLLREQHEKIKEIRPTPLERSLGTNAGAQFRLFAEINKAKAANDEERVASLEMRLKGLQAEMAKIDQAIWERMARIEAVRDEYQARLDALMGSEHQGP